MGEIEQQYNDNEQTGKYLTFRLADEHYGINVTSIQQLIAIPDIRALPSTPDFVRGVMNLRGRIMPVIDLRLRFALPSADYTARTSVIIVKTTTDKEETSIGCIVDAVAEVLDIQQEAIEPPPAFGAEIDTDYIMGMAKINNQVVILLNTENVLAGEDFVLPIAEHELDPAGRSM